MPIYEELAQLLPTRRGHFRFESGHHGDLWLDLEALCWRPEPVQRWSNELAARLVQHDIEVVCGPLVEGAFVGLFVALRLGVPFTYAERAAEVPTAALFPAQYRIPDLLRAKLHGRRVAIVNDVINAGSAVRGTYADLIQCGAMPVAIGTLAVLGDAAAHFTTGTQLALETLASFPNAIWEPQECPLCARGVPLSH